MIESIVKYVALIALAGAGISFVVGLWKYLDQRRREERSHRFKSYHELMTKISALNADGSPCPLSQQVAAIYELQNFTDYAFASTPILRHMRETFVSRGSVPDVVFIAIDDTLHVLETACRR